mmetsp:Transcript_9546/g.22610  ORF Transcript_9546/g.22610 Transcript_9546/m.22610 type:complete len:149 (-) Transcript_9546:112-558(-)|eukprot:3473275-Rhodomonas_salina.5
MGNLSSSLFASSAEKEFKRLTKKNTKANRDGVLGNSKPEESLPRTSSGGNIRFGKLVTEVTYDHECGEIEIAQEALYAPDDSGEDEQEPATQESPVRAAADGSVLSPAQAQARKKAILRNAGSFNAGSHMRAASHGSSPVAQSLEGRV